MKTKTKKPKKKKPETKVSEKQIDFVLGIGHLCLGITLIMLVWNSLWSFIGNLNIYLQTLFLLITGVGACMIYMFMGFMLQDLKMVIFEEEFKSGEFKNGKKTKKHKTKKSEIKN